MHDAVIVCVGDELLTGDTTDIHGAYLARYLNQNGIRVREVRLVGDSVEEIVGLLRDVVGRVRLVVMTGGLGPTSDDLTREAMAMAADVPLEHDEALWLQIQQNVGRPLSGSNRRQASRPRGFSALANQRGTAPGLLGSVGDCRLVALPGPPHELHGMIERHGDTILEGMARPRAREHTLSCFGVAESALEDALANGRREGRVAGGLTWHTRAGAGRIVVSLRNGAPSEFAAAESALISTFGRERVASGECTIAELVVAEMEARGLVLATAESCTGGMVGAALTDVPGSSAVFWGSMVTYANGAKESVLGVRSATLDADGAVSERCVREMAEGVRRISGSDVALSISGVAGPDGGTEEKPVGTVWIAVSTVNETVSERKLFSGNRERVRRLASVHGLLLVRRVALLA